MEDTDFHELGRQLLTEFGSMHQRISRFADKALGGEMAVMRALMLAGGSLTPSELADRAWVSSARIANILRALEAKGWVERESATTHGRISPEARAAAGISGGNPSDSAHRPAARGLPRRQVAQIPGVATRWRPKSRRRSRSSSPPRR